MPSNPNPNIDEGLWIINIRRTLEEELEYATEIPVGIFNVPKTLMYSDPDSYTPQEVAIGPYHYCRPELYEMERYKLAAAKRAQRQFQLCNHKFQCIVDQLTDVELQIRAFYHKFLNFSNETLAWMMAIDASFLLEFLHIYAMKEGHKLSTSSASSSISHLVDYAGIKSAHNAILRDMVMLENQIPLFVLRRMLGVQYSSSEAADDTLLQAMLMGFCKELSPFQMTKDNPMTTVTECAHLLDCLYDTIVPKAEQIVEINTEVEDQGEATQPKESYPGESTNVLILLIDIWKQISKLNIGPICLIKRLLQSRPLKLFFKLPWTMLSKLPLLSILAKPIECLLFPEEKESDDYISSYASNDINKPPLIEEITIPSVTELYKSNVTFSATTGNISTISFDTKTATLHLPTISLDVNSKVILSNLVAYEASNASGPLVLTRYTELMNGIIDTEEDVKLLREKGIILNRLKSDAEVANLWNGMNKSIKLTKVPHLDKVIEDVNKYYNNRWKVKFGKNMKLYVFSSWQFLILLATIILLLLMICQAFCSVYNCRKFNNILG